MNHQFKWPIAVLYLALSGYSICAYATEFHVATVVNFREALETLAKPFMQNTGHKMLVTADAAGNLYSKIHETPTIDVFLSSDVLRPKMLEEKGLGIANTRFTYAIGKLVLWSPNADLVDAKGEVLKTEKFSRLVIYTPKVAPYGMAAQQVLKDLGLWEQLQPKLLMRDNGAQMMEALKKGEAELGFIALSMLNPSKKIEGSLWVVPKKLYEPIEQQAILLKHGENNEAAKAFLQFLRTPHAQNVIESYGYSLPVSQ